MSIWLILLWMVLIFTALGVVVTLPRWLIDVAWERRGTWLKVVEFLRGLFIVVVGLVVGYALLIGVTTLWDEIWPAFLVSAGALAFVIYFYVSKDEANRKHSPQLTPKTAENIVRDYGGALARGCPDNGIARYESYLPCSKERIIAAFKIVLAYLIDYESLTQENYDRYVGVAMYLDAFVPDEKADRINRGVRSLQNEEYSQYISSMVNIEIKEQLDRFIEEVRALDKDDPLFQQRVYTLVGLEYSPTLKKKWNMMFSEDD